MDPHRHGTDPITRLGEASTLAGKKLGISRKYFGRRHVEYDPHGVADLSEVCLAFSAGAKSRGYIDDDCVRFGVETLINCAAGAACRHRRTMVGEPDISKWKRATYNKSCGNFMPP